MPILSVFKSFKDVKHLSKLSSSLIRTKLSMYAYGVIVPKHYCTGVAHCEIFFRVSKDI